MSKNIKESDQRGRVIADDSLDGVEITNHVDLRNDGRPHRRGSLEKEKRSMEEADQPGGIAVQSDEEVRNAAMEEFASKIKKAVSAKLMGRKLNLNLKGRPDLVNHVVKMIKLESEYLNALITGQAADTPALQKNKAIIDAEAKKLDRMLATNDFWPFK